MTVSAASQLQALDADFATHGSDAQAKLGYLRVLEVQNLRTADEVSQLHEILCFLRAYPDDPQVLRQAERMLEAFQTRGDLRRHRRALENSGIAGTDIAYRFYWPTAHWLCSRWPELLSVDWAEWERRDWLVEVLPLLLPYSESPALDELDHAPADWVAALKNPDETDAAFVIGRVAAAGGDLFQREKLYDTLDVPLRIAAGEDTPARGSERVRGTEVTFQRAPLSKDRPDLWTDVLNPPLSLHVMRRRHARDVIDVARGAMVTRSRDLDGFANADPADVRWIDCGGGLAFACLGLLPERRLMLESSYALLTVKNGVPLGYVLISALFGSAAIAYNVFETFRGAEAAKVFGRVLAVARHVFGVDTFSIDPFQLGYGNKEGLASGAWWFYYKLGFRPRDREVRRVMRSELRNVKADPSHRSSLATLEQLAAGYMYLELGEAREDVLGEVPLGEIGLALSHYLAGRFGANREAGLRTCSSEAAELLGTGPAPAWTRAERLWWTRWAPLVCALPGVSSWPKADREEVAAVIRAKGGRHESAFVPRFDAHRRLRQAVLSLPMQS